MKKSYLNGIYFNGVILKIRLKNKKTPSVSLVYRLVYVKLTTGINEDHLHSPVSGLNEIDSHENFISLRQSLAHSSYLMGIFSISCKLGSTENASLSKSNKVEIDVN